MDMGTTEAIIIQPDLIQTTGIPHPITTLIITMAGTTTTDIKWLKYMKERQCPFLLIEPRTTGYGMPEKESQTCILTGNYCEEDCPLVGFVDKEFDSEIAEFSKKNSPHG